MVAQANTNTRDQFLDSTDLRSEVVAAVYGIQTSHAKMFDMFFSDGRIQVDLIMGLGDLAYESTREPTSTA